MLQRFHITFGKKRTTITVDTILSEMMAIHLHQKPGTEEAHRAVRLWLQDTLVSHLEVTKAEIMQASTLDDI